jgi:uncharacterized protein (TIGR03545 family)
MIRWKVFLPFVGLVALISFFVLYRLDIFVKSGLESAISAATNTRTDISRLRISLVNSSLTIRRLEVASAAEEFKNAVEFGDIIVDFQFLPLLQKRFIVDDFSIKGVAWGTPRKTSGRLPPKPPSSGSSFLGEISDEAWASLKSEFAQLPVAKLADFELPRDPQAILDRLDLQSLAAFKKVTTEAQEIRTEWQGRMRELRDISELKKIVVDAQKLVDSAPQNPQEILKRIDQVRSLTQQVDVQKKKAEALMGDVGQTWTELQGSYDTARAAVEKDWQRAQALVGFDAFDTQSITRMIFGQEWVDRTMMFLRLQQAWRKKLSLLASSSKDDGIEVRPRATGRDIVFIRPDKKPSFLVSRSEFSVLALDQGDRSRVSQKYELKLADLTSNPRLHGKPTTVDVKGEFRDFFLSAAGLNLFLDYTTDKPTDRVKATMTGIKAENWPMGIPKIFPLSMKSGVASLESDFESVADKMEWSTRVRFSGVSWNVGDIPQAGMIVPLLTRIFSEVNQFSLRFVTRLNKGNLEFEIGSDLDQPLKRGVEAYIGEKSNEFKARLRKGIDAQVLSARSTALAEVNRFQTDVRVPVETRLREVNRSLTQMDGLVRELQKKAQKGAGDNLIKRLPKLPGLPK